MCSPSINYDIYTFTSILFFFNCNQSICYQRLQNKKNCSSSFITNSCIFQTRQTDLLPRVQNQRNMCSPFINYDTYIFTSVVFFFNYNQSTTNGFKTRRTVLPYSLPTLVYFRLNKLTCYQESKIDAVCVIPPSILIPTHLPLQYSFSIVINQSTTSGFKTRRTVLPHSLPTLVYFVHNKLTCYHESKINVACVLPPSILISVHLPLQQYSFSIAINQSTTSGFKTRRTVLLHSLSTLVYFRHDKLTCYQESKINAVYVLPPSILISTYLPLQYSFSIAIN